MNAEDAKVVEAVGAEADAIAQAIEWAAERFRRGGRLDLRGGGDVGPARGARRLGVSAHVQHAAGAGRRPDRGGPAGPDPRRSRGPRTTPIEARPTSRRSAVRADDLVVGIATSGRTPYVLGAVREARRRGRGDGGHRLQPPEPARAGGRPGDRPAGRPRGDRRARPGSRRGRRRRWS